MPTSRTIPMIVLSGSLLAGAILANFATAESMLNRTSAQTGDDERVAKVKSAYLLNFIKFTSWSPDHFASAESPIVLTVLGKDPLGAVLDATFNSKKIHNRMVEVRRIDIPDGFAHADDETSDDGVVAFKALVRQSHMIYIPQAESNRTKALCALVRDTPTVTVGDGADHVRRGAMLGFMIQDRKLVFTANHEQISSSGLRLSSKLLQLARPLPDQ